MSMTDTNNVSGWGFRNDERVRPPQDEYGNSSALSGREKDMVTTDDQVADGALFQRLMGLYTHELGVQASWRGRMGEDEANYDGDQLSAEVKAELARRNQLPITYNVIKPAVDWLLGTERRARTQPRILGRTKAGAAAAERKTQLMKYVQDSSQGEMHVSLAYRDAVRAGLGWLECGHQGEEEGEAVFVGSEPWRNILHDSRSTDLALADGRYIFRTRWTDMDIAARFFPNKQVMLQQSAVLSGSSFPSFGSNLGDSWMDEMEELASQNLSQYSEGDSSRDRVRLIEGWYRTPADTEVLMGGEFGGSVYFPGHRGHEHSIQIGKAHIISKLMMRTHVGIFCDKGLLHSQPSPYIHNRFPLTPIWGNRKAGTGEPYGVVRNMVPIQSDVNMRAIKQLAILASNKVIMDEGAVEDLDELADEVARSDGIIVKRPGKELVLGVDRELLPAHMELFSRGINMIQQISGVTDESMGRSTNATSGRAILARQEQGSVTTAHFLDNLRYALRAHGEKTLSLIEQYFTEEKDFRITNQRGNPDYVTVNDGEEKGDIAATRADFVVSEDEWKATVKQQQVNDLLEVVQQLAPVAPQFVFALLDVIVDMMDLPHKSTIVARIRAITGQEDPDADPDAADPETIARRESKAAQAEMERRGADAAIATQEAAALEKQAKAFKLTIESFRVAHGISHDTLQNLLLANETAVAAAQSRPVAPVADSILAASEQAAATAMQMAMQQNQPGGQQQPPPQAQQAPPPEAMQRQLEPTN